MYRRKTPFWCDLCDMYFSARRNLVRHTNCTHKNLNFNCKICGKEFKRVDNLNKHCRNLHGLQDQPSIQKKGSEYDVSHYKEHPSHNNHQSEADDEQNDDFASSKCNDEESIITSEEFNSSSVECMELGHEHNQIDEDPQVDVEEEHDLKPQLGTEMQNEEPISIHSDHEAETSITNKHKQSPENFENQVTKSDSESPELMPRSFEEELDFTVLDILHQNALDSKDEDRLFLLSVLSDLKKVPQLKKLKVKAKIVAAITEELE